MSLHDCATGACSIGAPRVTVAEMAELKLKIPDWEIVTIDAIDRLVRTYTFADFTKAQAFANKVGNLAERYGHHPVILLEWGKVEVSWWSHKIKGLHKNDFILAAKTDRLL